MLRPNPSLMMPEQCRLTLVPIRSYHSSHGVLPHTILSFPFIPPHHLGLTWIPDFADEPSCITCRCSGLHSHSSGRSNADFLLVLLCSSQYTYEVLSHPILCFRSIPAFPGFPWKSSDLVLPFIPLLLLFSYADDTYSAETLDEAHPRFIRIHFYLPRIHSCSSSSSPHVRLVHPAIRPARLPRPGR
ncbi:hypothetical protein R3P38DRAFT_3271327 [Favolaschia claudopus]|uniref:Uncharacterized protein n=1 Tax=Favolaschia claudopus TaxID=2862362 RepID=A0AAW0B9V8_9AGAR